MIQSITKKRAKKIKASYIVNSTFIYLGIIIISLIFLFPVLWLVLASFSDSGSMYSFNGFFPKKYSLNSFKTLFTDVQLYNYPRWFLNTLLISTVSSIVGTFLVILTAYTISRFRFPSRKKLMKGTLVLGMFPSFMSMIAVYLLMTQFNLVDKPLGLALIYAAGAPMGYLTQKGFFDTISGSIEDAARIDGATNFKVFIKIILPMSKPILVYTLLTQFAWPWSDFILPKLLLKHKKYYTVAVGLMTLGDDEFARFAAGSIFIAVPIIILYFSLAKFLIKGIASGAVKE
ncbi:MAG TPA: ABC transporter permease subunit [Clostridia bacterium]